MNFELLLFYALAAVALISAFAMTALVRNVLAGAICLLVTVISLAGIYVLLEAHFVAAIQIVVYAGAILMLFVLVIMLLNLRVDSFGPARPALAALRIGGIAAALSIFALLITQLPGFAPFDPVPPGFGGFRQVGIALYTDFVVPLEIASLLLLGAIVGAVVLAKPGADE